MVSAEQDEIVHLRLAAVGPVNDMVCVYVLVGGAAGKAAALVATLQRAPNRRRDAASLAADVQCRAVLVFAPVDEPAVASEPSGRFRGNACAGFQFGFRGMAIGRQRVWCGVQIDGAAVATGDCG